MTVYGYARISDKTQQIISQVDELKAYGIPEENILEKHIEGIQRYCGSNAKVKSLASQWLIQSYAEHSVDYYPRTFKIYA